MDAPAGTGNGVAFEVADLERTVSELLAAGIATDAIFVSPTCRSTSLRDPEGNRLVLHETAVTRRGNAV